MTDRRRKWLHIVLWLLVVLWMAVTYAFSAQNAQDSNQTSGRVIRWLLTHFDGSFAALSPEAQLLRIREWSHAVRKLAHFILFTGAGFLAFAAFSADLPPRRAFPAALGLGAAQAVLDEVHQSFVPGRSAEFRDVCIDFGGVLLGASVLLFILWLIQRKRKRYEKQKKG